MAAAGEEVGGHGVLYLVATFLQQRHISCQSCGVAGDVNDAPGRIQYLNIRDGNHIHIVLVSVKHVDLFLVIEFYLLPLSTPGISLPDLPSAVR